MQGIAEKGICFVIAPIGDEGSEIRRRSDQVLKHIITPAAYQCGYKTVRADTISEPGMITSQVIQHLVEDLLVIADLTGRNPNVFYELAVRHAVRKPCVQIIQMGEPIPFDVSQSRTIQVDHHDLDSVSRCIEELVKQIRSVEKDASDIDTPITVAIDLQSLRQSENPLEKSNAEIITMLQDLSSRFGEFSDVIVKQLDVRPRIPDGLVQDIFFSIEKLNKLIEFTFMPKEVDEKELEELRRFSGRLQHQFRILIGELGYSPRRLPDELQEYERYLKRKRASDETY